MASKCRICGYKFKTGDGSICPECFTAREDELSLLGGEYKRSSIFGRDRNAEQVGDFLADELKEERHEDISMKKALDREDALKTRAFASQGGNVKNETYRDAFRERISRDRSEQGRVYTDRKNSKVSGNTSANAAQNKPPESFLDSIDPTLRSRIYNDRTDQQENYRYSHHTSNQSITSNQQMLYGLNAGKAPDDPGRETIIYNFPPRNNSKYSKGSNSKAAAVAIVSVTVFFLIVGAISAIDERNNNKKDDNKSSGMGSISIELPDVDIPSIPDINIPDINIPGINGNDTSAKKLSDKYGSGKITLSGCEKGDIVDNPLNDDEKKEYVYPVDELINSGEKYREITLKFLVNGISRKEDLPELDEMILVSTTEDNMMCVSYGYDMKTDTVADKNGDFGIKVRFIVPEKSDEFGLDICYTTPDNPGGYATIQRFDYSILDQNNEQG